MEYRLHCRPSVDEAFSFMGHARVRAWFGRQCVYVRMVASNPNEPRDERTEFGFCIALDEVGPPHPEVTGWAMARGVPPSFARTSDPFARVAEEGVRYLGRPPGEVSWRDFWRSDQGTRGRAELRRFRACVKELAVRAAALCEPALRRTALRFSPPARLSTYLALRADGSGRLAQLVDTAPGVLVLMSALDDVRYDDARRELLRDVRAGRPLKGTINEYLRASARADIDHGDPALHLPWREGHVRVAMRTLLRRAGVRVSPRSLRAMPPPVYVPEDIPRSTLANARWFKTMAWLAWLVRINEEYRFDPAVDDAARALSKHAANLPGSRRLTDRRVAALVEYASCEGRAPNRRSDLKRWFCDAVTWRRAREDDDAKFRDILPETQLPQLPNSAWEGPGVEIRPIRTVGELNEEGEAMKHCAATRAPAAIRGECWVFSVRLGETRLTVELVKRGAEFVVGQFTGVGNREVTQGERGVVEPWLRQLLQRGTSR